MEANTMNLKRLTANNVKGRDFDLEFAPVTLITGDNFSGKTAVMDAIRVTLLGYLSSLGKLPSATYQLAGNNELMRVLALFDTGSIERSWAPKKDGTVAYKSDVKGIPETPAVLLDIDEYLRKTAKERVLYAFSQLNLDGDAIGQRVTDVLDGVEVFPSQQDAKQSIADEIFKVLSVGQQARWAVQDRLDKIISRITEIQKKAKEDGERAGTEFRALSNGHKATDVTEQWNALEKSIKDATAARQEWAVRIEQIKSIKSALAQGQQTIGSIQKEISSEFDAVSVEQEIDGFKDNCQALEKLLRVCRVEYATKKEEVKGHLAAKTLLTADKQETLAEEKCPTCKSKGKAWKEAFTLDIDSQVAAVDFKINELNKRLPDLRKAGEELAAQLNKAQAVRDAIAEKRALLTLHNTARSSLVARLAEQAILADKMAKMETLEMATQCLVKTEQSIKDNETAKTALRPAYDAWMAHKSTEAWRKTLRDSADSHAVTVELASRMIKSVTELQQTVLNEAFGPLLDVANKFSKDLLLSPIAYNNGELGRWWAGTWIIHKAGSGYEQSLMYAALSVALANTAPFKIVLIDECGIIHPARKASLVQRLLVLIQEGVIHQAVLLDVTGVGYPVEEGFKIIAL